MSNQGGHNLFFMTYAGLVGFFTLACVLARGLNITLRGLALLVVAPPIFAAGLLTSGSLAFGGLVADLILGICCLVYNLVFFLPTLLWKHHKLAALAWGVACLCVHFVLYTVAAAVQRAG